MNVAETHRPTPKAHRTRKAIIDAARKLVGSAGVDGVTVMAVCDGAQVGRTSFYNYFLDTQALLETLALDVGQEVQAEFEAVHGGLERGLERLERCISMLFHKAASDPEFGLLITALANSYPDFAMLLEEQIQIELEAGFAERELASSPKEREAILNFLVVTIWALMRDFASKEMDPASVDKHVQYVMQATQPSS